MVMYEHDGMSDKELSRYVEEIGYDSEDAIKHVSNFRRINRYLPLAAGFMLAFTALGLYDGLISGRRGPKSLCLAFAPIAFYCAYKTDKTNLRFEDVIETVKANKRYKEGNSPNIASWVKPLDKIRL